MMNFIRLILVFFLFISLSGCQYSEYNPDVCFQENVLPIFVSKCSMTGCHNSVDKKARYDLSNYDGIMKGVSANHPLFSSVYTSVAGINPSMPRGGTLSEKEKSYIKIWIRMGAKNTSNCSSCDTSTFTYNAVIKPIITDWCLGCHSPSNAGGGFDYSTYSGVVASVANNKLMGSIEQLSGHSPMPQGTKLSDCDIKLIGKWVSAGYPNN
jgi:hypothetical protein